MDNNKFQFKIRVDFAVAMFWLATVGGCWVVNHYKYKMAELETKIEEPAERGEDR
jgi:hypothetical protein